VDTALHEAVQRFQERHGLTVDGAVGPATRAALNVPVEERIEQITLNLERWRWLPADLGRLHVRVNIAGFDLRVVEEGTDRLQMRVVAGRAYRQTPVFSDQISYLVLNPYWHVPHSIAVKDKLPDFRRDPSLVSKLGYEVFRGWGADATPIDPSTIDWNAVSASSFPYRLRQRPGPQNALGQVKFMFPNAHSIYLHDTPSRALFGQAERNFSSGCIRVEHPLDLAAVLLRHNEGWTRERIESTVGNDTEKTVVLPEKVPVHLLYWTAWATADGPVHFRRDVYDRDEAVHSALAAPLDREAANEDIGGSSSPAF
jgi:murein L,D-transpeptidase YcbB/YkuD